jgi:hypothetical protein
MPGARAGEDAAAAGGGLGLGRLPSRAALVGIPALKRLPEKKQSASPVRRTEMWPHRRHRPRLDLRGSPADRSQLVVIDDRST